MKYKYIMRIMTKGKFIYYNYHNRSSNSIIKINNKNNSDNRIVSQTSWKNVVDQMLQSLLILMWDGSLG